MKSIPLFLLLFFGLTAPAAADIKSDYARAQLLSATTGTGDLKELDMALDITLDDGWYTYWRMAGDNGLPPIFDWTNSENVKSVTVSYPAPKRFTLEGMHSFGYVGNVLFPLKVIPETPGKDIVLHLKADLMVCNNICIPQTVTMMRKFSHGAATPSEHAAQIKSAIESLPADTQTKKKDLAIETVVLGRDALVITARANTPWDATTDMIVESPGAFLLNPPEIVQGADGQASVLKINAPQGLNLTDKLFGKTIRILLIHQGQAVEKEVTL